MAPLLLIALAWPAHAQLPMDTFPECGEPDRPDLCPADLDEEWALISYIPEHARETVRGEELELGSGMHADRAWRTTVGRWDVILGIADSGIEWENTNLIDKVHVNVGELPLPQDASGQEYDDYDANGDTIVNVQDWADDPRVDITAGRDEADALLDPSDLIYTFSDGVDDDGNGYVDDIAGWDFFGRDNDPGHDMRDHFGDHGSGVAEEAGAEGDDTSDIGVCPNCSLLPVRMGDTFITDGIRAGEAIAFAVDSGAVAVTLAAGALSNADLTQAAVRYAWDNGVVIAGAAGDENSYHHNFPAVLDNIIYTHSIRYNTGSSGDDVYSYMNTLNCNNFGARMVVVAPSGACATGAVANTVGLIGLVNSVARDQGLELDAGEIYQLIVQSADDIWLSDDELGISGAYPSDEGWDPFYGYGRTNAERAVQAVVAGDIPPWVTIDGPEWFQTLDPAVDTEVVIEGTISAERSGSYSYEVEIGQGHNPREWSTIGSGSGSGSQTGVLARFDVGSLDPVTLTEPDQEEGIVGRLQRVNAPAVTVRVRVVDDQGLTAEMRKTFFVREDPDTVPGFPLAMGSSGESSPILADITGDGVYEVLVGTASGQVLAVDGQGQMVDGWPVTVLPLDDYAADAQPYADGTLPAAPDGIMATVAAGDLDGDGVNEVVAASSFGGLYAWRADGTLMDGFPVWTIGREPDEFDDSHSYDQGYAAAPTLYDLDGDGVLEIIALGLDSRLYVYTDTGDDWGPYPVEICHPSLCGVAGRRIIDSATVGDMDGDGQIEIVFGTNEAVNGESESVTYMMDAVTGEHEDGWPISEQGLVAEAVLLPMIGEGHPASPAAVDLDGDGDLELFNPVMLGTTDVLDAGGEPALEIDYYANGYGAGSNVSGSMAPMILQFVSNPGVGDINQDGTPDLILGGASTLYVASLAMTRQYDYQHALGAWDGSTGEMLHGWPRQIEDLQFLLAPAIADLSGDGKPEVIYASAGYLVHAWDVDGASPEGWPKFTGNWIMGSPAVGDITGDGYLEVVTTTREGWLFAWTTRGRADQAVEWASMFHDPQNTGNYEHPMPAQAGPTDPPQAEDAKGCCKGRHGDTAAVVLLPLLFGWRRRRRGDAAER